MRHGTKMMLATAVKDRDNERKQDNGRTEQIGRAEYRYDGIRNLGDMNYPGIYPRYEMNYPRNEEDNRRGRESDHRSWERGGRMEYNDDMEDRFRDRRGREHYDNGRFAPMRNEMRMADRNDPFYPITPPIRQEHDNPIGFSSGGSTNIVPFRMNEHDSEKFTREMAEEWTAKMENEDGTRGPHWNMDQTKQVMAQKNIDVDPIEFYLAMNMMYSDYCKVAKKLNVNNTDFYANMAKAFLEDKDAGGRDKLMRYYKYVVM